MSKSLSHAVAVQRPLSRKELRHDVVSVDYFFPSTTLTPLTASLCVVLLGTVARLFSFIIVILKAQHEQASCGVRAFARPVTAGQRGASLPNLLCLCLFFFFFLTMVMAHSGPRKLTLAPSVSCRTPGTATLDGRARRGVGGSSPSRHQHLAFCSQRIRRCRCQPLSK